MLIAAIPNLVPRECRDLERHHDDAMDMPCPTLLALAGSSPASEQTPYNVRVERMPAPLKLFHVLAIVRGGHCEFKAPTEAPLVHELADVELKSEGRAALRAGYAVMTLLMKKGRGTP